jgi:hypothetical protein
VPAAGRVVAGREVAGNVTVRLRERRWRPLAQQAPLAAWLVAPRQQGQVPHEEVAARPAQPRQRAPVRQEPAAIQAVQPWRQARITLESR